MDNDWHKIIRVSLLFALGATIGVCLIALMLYTPELFK